MVFTVTKAMKMTRKTLMKMMMMMMMMLMMITIIIMMMQRTGNIFTKRIKR